MFGQKLNLNKTEVSCSPSTPPHVQTKIHFMFQVSNASGHNKYFGLPSLIGRKKSIHFQSLKEFGQN